MQFHIMIPLMVVAICCTCVYAADSALPNGIDRANFDTSVRPNDDIFQFVNGNWVKNNPIPPEYSRWGAFGKLHDDNLFVLRLFVVVLLLLLGLLVVFR